MLTIPDLTEIGIELSASVLVRSRVELPDDLRDLCRVAQRFAHSAVRSDSLLPNFQYNFWSFSSPLLI